MTSKITRKEAKAFVQGYRQALGCPRFCISRARKWDALGEVSVVTTDVNGTTQYNVAKGPDGHLKFI